MVAIKKKNGQMLFNPASETILEPGDTLVSMGHKEHLSGCTAAGEPAIKTRSQKSVTQNFHGAFRTGLYGDNRDLFDRRRKYGAGDQAGFRIAFPAQDGPVRHPDDGFVIAGRDLLQAESPRLVGARVIGMIDDEQVGVHPEVAGRAAQVRCDARPIEAFGSRPILVDERQREKRCAPCAQGVIVAVA